MAEQTGHSVAALQARQAELVRRYSTVADADRVLAEALVAAHAATVEGARRLEAIAHVIDNAVQNQSGLAVDTPTGAREFQKFLIAKLREIIAVVSDARNLTDAKTAVLEELRSHYVS